MAAATAPAPTRSRWRGRPPSRLRSARVVAPRPPAWILGFALLLVGGGALAKLRPWERARGHAADPPPLEAHGAPRFSTQGLRVAGRDRGASILRRTGLRQLPTNRRRRRRPRPRPTHRSRARPSRSRAPSRAPRPSPRRARRRARRRAGRRSPQRCARATSAPPTTRSRSSSARPKGDARRGPALARAELRDRQRPQRRRASAPRRARRPRRHAPRPPPRRRAPRCSLTNRTGTKKTCDVHSSAGSRRWRSRRR